MANETIGGAVPIGPELTLDAARRRAASLLAPVSGSEAALDARILLEDASGLDRAALLREGDARLGEPAAAHLRALLARRLKGEPVWRILGRREFWGLPFAITPAVLDPRPDSETVVAAAVEAFRARRVDPLRILDLGTGSGALICAICSEFPNAQGWGVDRSHAACTVAQRNVAALGLAGRVLIVNGNWGDACAGSSFDLIVSNPPYIETAVIAALAPEVRNFDPHVALDGGSDGFAAYRDIVRDLPRLLRPAALAVLEVGSTQADAVCRLLADAGLGTGAVHRDLGGNDRAVSAFRRTPAPTG